MHAERARPNSILNFFKQVHHFNSMKMLMQTEKETNRRLKILGAFKSKVLMKTEVKDMIQIASMKKKDMGKFLKLKVETKAKEN